ncbi:MAG: hypothetical protein IKW28_11505 [Lachnospiraceae bacterium]|nr:hypothetical protein [Lachnospiraceae bacterium]
MTQIVELMITSFEDIRESGSYFLFYLLSLGLGLAIAWERYSSREKQDPWMLEEAKEKIHLWPFLYGLLILVLVVANPLVIWIFNKITPMEGQYHRIWFLMPVIFLSAYGIVCFLGLLREARQKVALSLGFIILIALAGNFYGYMSDRKNNSEWEDERQVLTYIDESSQEKEVRLLATEEVLEYAGNHYPKINLLYGKDLYTPHMDLGIMDAYDPELMVLYEAMKAPEEKLELIAQYASLYHCNIIVLPEFQEYPHKQGEYRLVRQLGQYLIYQSNSR